jgi:hypothetical protein
MTTVCWSENLKEKCNLKDVGVHGRIISNSTLRKWDEDVDWIHLAQVTDKWRDLVNMVMNLRVP